MIRRLFELTEEHHSSLWFIAGICFLLFLWTAFMCYLPLWITVGQTGLSIISALGAGLMVGAAFTVSVQKNLFKFIFMFFEEIVKVSHII